ncbi:MAG: hypothetical protein KTR18_14985 [Acidiferrobacterales bacterium]|nr:hypothetical protein [Acidiferrobacterales bacterium]
MTDTNPWPARPERLVICIGAQKAATSFVFDQLVDNPRVLTPPRKEVHFWSTVEGQVHPIWLKRSKDQYQRILRMLPLNFLRQGRDSIKKLREAKQMLAIRQGGPKAWDTYQEMLSPINPEQTVAFEATPGYALLSADTFRQMAEFHENLYILYIVRDPVKRLWSDAAYSIRHEITKGLKSNEDVNDVFHHSLEERDRRFQHSNYPEALDRLAQAGLKDKVHVMFMETMKEDRELSELEQALGLKPELNFERVVNSNPHKSRLPPEQHEYGVRIMAPIYSEMRNRFGDRVPDSWFA